MVNVSAVSVCVSSSCEAFWIRYGVVVDVAVDVEPLVRGSW